MPTFTGTTGNDTLTGTGDADTIIAGGGVDTINADNGDDTVIVVSQPSAYGTINGGGGIDTLQVDRMLTPVTVQGAGGAYALNLAVMNNTAQTFLTSFERLVFNSLVGDQFNVLLAYGGNGGAANQIGSGLAANAEVVGGAGQDLLNLSWNSANTAGTVTAPTFSYTNWDTQSRAYLGDRVTVSVIGNGDTTMIGTAHAGVQGLNGGGGNDIIQGSNDMDLISGGAGGNDQLFGNGGDDTLFIVNTYFIPPGGSPGAESTRTGAGSLFDGGTGTDFLMLGGNVNFQGTLASIEGLVLLPGYTNTNAGAFIAVASQYNTQATFSNATFSALPANLLVAGEGLVVVNLGSGGDTFNGSAFQFDPGTDVSFYIEGGAGNDSITGTISTDTLIATGGSDTLNGLAGDDTLWLYSGAASAQGGANDDTFNLMMNGGASNIDGGDGYDILRVEQNAASLTYNPLTGTLAGIEQIHLIGTALALSGANFNTGFSSSGVVSGTGTIIVAMTAGEMFLAQNLDMQTSSVAFNIIGSADIDVIKCNLNAVNFISGNGGVDQIRGGNFSDTINGGDGADKIMGLSGADQLTGGAGADQFRYLFTADSGIGSAADVILDFSSSEDRLSFVALDANPLVDGRQALTFIDTQAFSATGTGEIRYGVSGGNLLVQADLDGNGTVDMEFILQGAAAQTLTGANFMF